MAKAEIFRAAYLYIYLTKYILRSVFYFNS
jgi:hypothetical protein